jgi:DNA recombination protein RmuC
MTYFIVLFLLIIVIVFNAIFVFLFFKKRKPPVEKDSLLLLQQQISQLNQTLDQKLSESNQSFQRQFQQSAVLVGEVTEKLTNVLETNRQVIGFAQQLQSLENILKNPKQRGILGEYKLKMLLEAVFTPKQFKMQYEFKDGLIVDAVLFIGDKVLPIDSKFSLENYNKIVAEKDPLQREALEKIFKQDLKSRIDETAKYIKPEEGTFDFALMFIPAEGIYYDLMVNEVGAVKANTRDLLQYAAGEKRVHIVSPNSFYAFLQTILQGLRAFEIEKSALQIRQNVELLGKHIKAYEEYMKKLGSHLQTTCKTYNTAYKELGKIDKDVVKISGGEKSVEALEIGASLDE